jgi:hypothetical protein
MNEYQVTVRLAVLNVQSMTEQQHLERLDRVGGKLAIYGAALNTTPASAGAPQIVEALVTYEDKSPGHAVWGAVDAITAAVTSEGYQVAFRSAMVQTPADWQAATGVQDDSYTHDGRD